MNTNNVNNKPNNNIDIDNVIIEIDQKDYIIRLRNPNNNDEEIGKTNYNIHMEDKSFNGNYISLYNLKINDKYQKQGYGNKLLQTVQEIFTPGNFKYITLRANINVCEFYFKNGFNHLTYYNNTNEHQLYKCIRWKFIRA